MNTYQNAKYISRILCRETDERVFIVTSGIHLRRSLLSFNHFGIEGTPIASDLVKAPIILLPLGFNFAIADLSFHDYVGIARLHLYNKLGWNKRDDEKARR